MGSCHHSASKILGVILDLDGTLLNTETAGVLKEFMAKYGKVWITDRANARVGKTQKESAVGIIEDYGLPLSPEEFIQEITPFYRVKFAEAKPLPGANRLIKHLHKHQIPVSLASNSSRENIDVKISYHDGWKDCFCCILGSDQVNSGKPAPDLFLETAKRMGVDPSHCLVVEDSLVGVIAAKAAGMKVVAVPSRTEDDAASLADSVLHSLLEFQPETWDLPPFDDWIDKAVQVDPIFLRGIYKDGLLVESPDQGDDGLNSLPSQVYGVFFGWAEVLEVEALKVVVAIGSECHLTSQHKIKTILLDADTASLTDRFLQLKLIGYIRGFNTQITNPDTSIEEVVEEDQTIARAALDHPVFVDCKPGILAP